MSAEIIRGFVIKKTNFGGNDQIITILTHNELISFLALGTQKTTSKNRFALEYCNLIEAEIFRARLRNKLSKLKRATQIMQINLQKSDNAQIVMQIMRALQNLDKPSLNLYNALIDIQPYFGDNYNHQLKTYVFYWILVALGYGPFLKACATCHRTDRILSFDFWQGGYLCFEHAKVKKTLEYLKAIESLDDISTFVKVDPRVNQEVFADLISFLSTHSFI